MTLTFEKIAELEQEYGTTMDVNFEMTECPRSCEICQEEAEAELRAHLKKRALTAKAEACVAGTCDASDRAHLSGCKKIGALLDEIGAMDHMTMCRLWRFGPKADGFSADYFRGAVGDQFRSRLFDHFGGFTSAISKELGWEA